MGEWISMNDNNLNYSVKIGNIFDYKADILVISAGMEKPYTELNKDGFGPLEAQTYNLAGVKELLNERKKVGLIEPGKVGVTSSCALKDRYKYIFHTPTPFGWDYEDFKIIEKAYLNSLKKADELGCKSIVFPLIATGVCEFTVEDGLSVAESTINAYVCNHAGCKLDITLVLSEFAYQQLISQAKQDLLVKDDKIEEELKQEWLQYSIDNESKAYRDSLLRLRKTRKQYALSDIEFSKRKNENFDLFQVASMQKKKLRKQGIKISNASIAEYANTSEDTVQRVLSGQKKEIESIYTLYKIGMALKFDLYKMNRTLELFNLPILKYENLTKSEVVYFYSFLHRIYDKDALERATQVDFSTLYKSSNDEYEDR